MLSDSAMPALATISYRIATEPNFVSQLRSLVKGRKLDTGQMLTEDEAAALLSFIEQKIPLPKTVSDWLSDPGALETWIG